MEKRWKKKNAGVFLLIGSWKEAYQVHFLDRIPIAAVFLVIVVTVLSIICALFFLWNSFKSDPIPFYLSLGCLNHIFGSCFNLVFPPVREPSDFKIRWGSCVWILCFFLCWLFAIDTLFFFYGRTYPLCPTPLTSHISHSGHYPFHAFPTRLLLTFPCTWSPMRTCQPCSFKYPLSSPFTFSFHLNSTPISIYTIPTRIYVP